MYHGSPKIKNISCTSYIPHDDASIKLHVKIKGLYFGNYGKYWFGRCSVMSLLKATSICSKRCIMICVNLKIHKVQRDHIKDLDLATGYSLATHCAT